MAPIKRKRPHDAAPESPPSAGEHQSSTAVTRRATRHTQASSTIAPLPWQADPEPRRRRRRAESAAGSDVRGRRRRPEPGNNGDDYDDDDDDQEPSPALTRTVGLRGRAVSVGPVSRGVGGGRPRAQQQRQHHRQPHRPVLRATTNQADRDPGLRAARKLRHQHDDEDDPDDHGHANVPAKPMHVGAIANLRHRGSAAVGPIVGSSLAPSKPPPQNQSPPPKPPSSPSSSSSPTVAPMTQLPSRSARVSDHVAANTSKRFAPPTTNPAQQPPRPAKKQQLAKDQRKPNTAVRNIDKVVFGNICFSTWYHSPYGTEALGEISGTSTGSSSHDGSFKEEGGLSNSTSRRTKEDKLDRLYVCPCCFKYSKELVPWWQHVHLCERRNYIPGEKIYTHPKGRRTRQVPVGAAAVPSSKGPGRKKKGPETTAHSVEETVEDQGEWSIWQVDGEKEGLFCQNLSLFAKLFLDNKSVFFDVVCFNYFLLVYTSLSPSPAEGDDPAQSPPPPRQQIVGFFSKEKLSWDNNNLACILIFPPWQRKGLGALLMGVSYEISRREGMIGGPEKPISDLGKRGYKRFWAGEIVAWILSLDTNGDEEVIVDIEECSNATWIVQEDCLAILREMAVVEEAGLGPPKPKRREVLPEDGDEDGGETAPAATNGDEAKEKKEVRRVRISKDAVWNWVKANGISLEKACDPNGFVDGYAIKRPAVEEEGV
ncbi:Males-absent on the first protein [Cytospora mali]|uniref:histone acetyltransferase n=1 Tax=Cytospora mali TaxID=578113 RepID=A0A194W8A6_CYTMA|nr:Males-absent on the first protein [Valsa mali]